MRVIGVLQARLSQSATRLPWKEIKPLNGLPMFVHLWRRLLWCKELDGVIVSCGSSAGGDLEPEMVSALKGYGVRYVAGPATDLISRHMKAVRQLEGDAFVRLTADCPFHDPKLIDEMVRGYRSSYPFVQGYANSAGGRYYSEGVDMELVGMDLLGQLDKDPNCDRETFCTYAINKGYLKPWPSNKSGSYGGELHLSVDTPEDFERSEAMLKLLGNDRWGYHETLWAYGQVKK